MVIFEKRLIKNMNIEKFFDLSTGKWFAHRTKHELTTQKSIESKSEILIDRLDGGHAEVLSLCETHNIQPSQGLLALKLTWNDTTRLNQKNVGSMIMVAVPNLDLVNAGKILFSNQSQIGEYKLGEDQALTLTLTAEQIVSEERLWFASDNLRMRVSTLKHANRVMNTAFTSEIRMGVPPKTRSQVAEST